METVSHIDRSNVTDLEPIAPSTETTTPRPEMQLPDPLADRPLPQPPQPPQTAAAAEPAKSVGPSLFVTFITTNAKGKQRHGRVFLGGVYDLRSVQQIANCEALIQQEKGLPNVEILGWRAVDA